MVYIDIDKYKENLIQYDSNQVQKRGIGIMPTHCDDMESYIRHELLSALTFSYMLDDYNKNQLENLIKELTKNDKNSL